MARPHRFSGLRGLRRRLGQDQSVPINWGSILQTGIVTAGQDAAVALTPPAYSSSVNYPGYSSNVTSYGPAGAGAAAFSPLGMFGGGSSLMPLLLLGGLGVVVFIATQRR